MKSKGETFAFIFKRTEQTCFSRIILSTAAIVTLNFELCFGICARAEYEINGECCPMCAPGNHVYWHCTVDTSTTCVPCPVSTYTDEPNGLTKCFSCFVCDASQGLKVNKACTRFTDSVCEPLQGFYCIGKNKDSCTLAIKHSGCNPGQYIKERGTAFTDTVCGDCTDATYSNGSFTTCKPHSKCESEGLTEIKAGTASSDAECGKSTPVGLIVGAIAGVLVVPVVASLIYLILKNKKHSTKRVRYDPQPDTENGILSAQLDL